MNTIFHILRIFFSNFQNESWNVNASQTLLSLSLWIQKVPYPFCMHFFFCHSTLHFSEKTYVGLGFKSYEPLHSMIGIKSTTTQTTSNLFLALQN